MHGIARALFHMVCDHESVTGGGIALNRAAVADCGAVLLLGSHLFNGLGAPLD